jgi:hypothetical protein
MGTKQYVSFPVENHYLPEDEYGLENQQYLYKIIEKYY